MRFFVFFDEMAGSDDGGGGLGLFVVVAAIPLHFEKIQKIQNQNSHLFYLFYASSRMIANSTMPERQTA